MKEIDFDKDAGLISATIQDSNSCFSENRANCSLMDIEEILKERRKKIKFITFAA